MKLLKIIVLLVVAVCIFIPGVVMASESRINVRINGNPVHFPDIQPSVINNRTYVPVRFVAEQIGADVEWIPDGMFVIVRLDNVRLVYQIDYDYLRRYENDVLIHTWHMDVTPLILDGRTMMPIRFVAEELGYDVDWIAETQTVTINYAGEPDFHEDPEGLYDPEPDPEGLLVPEQTPPPTSAPTQDNDAAEFEREVFRLVNEVRAEEGLSHLRWNDILAGLAREHSIDMYTRNFFSHTCPDGLGPFNRMRHGGYDSSQAAENLAMGQRTPESVMNSWMNSPGHRANILNPNLTEIGIGFYNNFWTQKFGSPR
jgi:hypothetical protein